MVFGVYFIDIGHEIHLCMKWSIELMVLMTSCRSTVRIAFGSPAYIQHGKFCSVHAGPRSLVASIKLNDIFVTFVQHNNRHYDFALAHIAVFSQQAVAGHKKTLNS